MIIEKVDKNIVPLDANEKAAPELKTNFNFRKSPNILIGPSDK